MKPRKYLTEYGMYDKDSKEHLVYAGPTIVAFSLEEAEQIISQHFDIAFRDYKIVNP